MRAKVDIRRVGGCFLFFHATIMPPLCRAVKRNLTAANVAARPRLTAHVATDRRGNPIFPAVFVQTATRCYMGVRLSDNAAPPSGGAAFLRYGPTRIFPTQKRHDWLLHYDFHRRIVGSMETATVRQPLETKLLQVTIPERLWARLVMVAVKNGASKTAVVIDLLATLPALESEVVK